MNLMAGQNSTELLYTLMELLMNIGNVVAILGQLRSISNFQNTGYLIAKSKK